MSESLFWWYIEKRKKKKIKTKDLDKLTNLYEEKILNLAKATKLYFRKDSPKSNRFYDNIGDCYDGICLCSQEVYKFYENIIMSGKNLYLEFIDNPFRGDIMLYLTRDVSCGNSSCLYLDFRYFQPYTSWEKLSGDIYSPSVELVNKIFDIIHNNE